MLVIEWLCTYKLFISLSDVLCIFYEKTCFNTKGEMKQRKEKAPLTQERQTAYDQFSKGNTLCKLQNLINNWPKKETTQLHSQLTHNRIAKSRGNCRANKILKCVKKRRKKISQAKRFTSELTLTFPLGYEVVQRAKQKFYVIEPCPSESGSKSAHLNKSS